MHNYKLSISYLGQAYFGWQRQPDPNTVQETIENALLKIGEKASVLASGRTDSKVSAFVQTANVKLKKNWPEKNLVLAINTHLPDDIRILEAKEVSLDFNAQKCAKWKWYRYSIQTGISFQPLWKDQCFWIKRHLNIDQMKKYALEIQGTHDFKAFQGTKAARGSTVKTIHFVQVQSYEWFPNHIRIDIDFVGTGFLKQMVRTLSGTLVEFGLEKEQKPFSEIFESKMRSDVGRTLPGHGLTLMKVGYDDFQIDLFKNSF